MPNSKHIIVIDDDKDVRNTICENLIDCGYNVLPADNGDVGLYYLKSGVPADLVITDIIMPVKEGLETIIEIRARYPKIKLLTISGGGRDKMGNFLSYAEKLGSDAVLAKPINMDELEATIRRLIN